MMNKIKSPIKIILIVLILLCAFFSAITLTIYLLFNASWQWTDYKPYSEFVTKDGKNKILIEVSYPPMPPNETLHIKIKCKENISQKEIEYSTLSFSVPPDEDASWFEFNEIDSENAELTVHSFHRERILEFNWNDIFG